MQLQPAKLWSSGGAPGPDTLLCVVFAIKVPAVNEVSLKNSKSLRLIFTGPTSGHPAEVVVCQVPEHTNWPYFPWTA